MVHLTLMDMELKVKIPSSAIRGHCTQHCAYVKRNVSFTVYYFYLKHFLIWRIFDAMKRKIFYDLFNVYEVRSALQK
jgi:hypothetical protein